MIVRLLVGILGTRDGEDWPPRGAEMELPDGEAAGMIAAGQAERADKPLTPPARMRFAHEVAYPSDGEVH